MKTWTGVGSRKAPRHICEMMEAAARVFAVRGWTLRSGRAPGPDTACEWGVRRAPAAPRPAAELYLPWPGFGDTPVAENHWVMERPIPEAYSMAQKVITDAHWSKLSSGGRALHARNAHQVLGPNLQDPSTFMLCWTPGGREIGGTATAIKLADYFGVEVHNLAMATTFNRIKGMLDAATAEA